MIADLEPPKILPDVRPGYRPPFNSVTGRAAALKAQARIRANRELVKTIPKPYTPVLTPRGKTNLLAAIRRAFRRHCDASATPELEDSGLNHAKIAKMFFDMEMELTGHKSSRANSTKNHGLQLSDTVAKVAPISTVKPMANPAPIPPVPEVQKPANPPEIDDCPF